MSKRERGELDTWIHAGCPPRGNKKIWNTGIHEKKTNWHKKSVSRKRRNEIVVKKKI